MQEINNLLNYALESGIIDLSALKYQCEDMKDKQLLKSHVYEVWQGKNGSWYTHLPDMEKGRKKVKRTTKEGVEKAIIDFYKENPNATNTGITLRELYKEWIVYKEARTKSSAYISRLEADWNKFYLGESQEFIDTPIKNLTKIGLDNWIHNLIKKHNMNKKKYYNVSIILRQCFEYALDCRYLEKNLLNEIKLQTELFATKKKPESETQVYQAGEAAMLVEDMYRRFQKRPYDTAPLAVILDFEIGARVGEYTKTKESDRYVYLTKKALEIINLIMETNKEYGNYCEDYLFCIGDKRITKRGVQSRIHDGCKVIGISEKSAHKIRKTYVSTLIDANLNIDEIRRQAGHANERTTYNNYCFNRKTSEETGCVIEKALANFSDTTTA